MLKKILFFIVLFYFSNTIGIALSDIVPVKKPSQTKEETKKKLLIDAITPLPKPIEKTEVKIDEKEVVVKKEKKDNY